jgi:hypothetical protein
MVDVLTRTINAGFVVLPTRLLAFNLIFGFARLLLQAIRVSVVPFSVLLGHLFAPLPRLKKRLAAPAPLHTAC